jgi:tetratricopeptide (TPR) repeat protein
MTLLSGAYLSSDKLDRALPLTEEALPQQKAKLGPEHPDTLACTVNLAHAYRLVGKPALALTLAEEALKLGRARPDHPTTLHAMNELATLYLGARKFDRAVPLFEEVLKLRKSRHGPNHPATLQSMANLAASYWKMKRLDKSIPLFEDTLKLAEKELGRDHLNTLLTVANLGVNYKDAGRLNEAIALLEEAHRAAQKNPQLRWVIGQLIDAYTKAGEHAKLAHLLLAQVAAARKSLPRDSPELASVFAQASLALLELKKWAEAESLLRECLAIREKATPDAWNTFNTMSTLGGALLAQKKYADAESLLLRGYEGMKAREKTIPQFGGGELRIPEALDRLIELATATDKPDEATRWRAERAKYPTIAPVPHEKK